MHHIQCNREEQYTSCNPQAVHGHANKREWICVLCPHFPDPVHILIPHPGSNLPALPDIIAPLPAGGVHRQNILHLNRPVHAS